MERKKKAKEFANPYSVTKAFKNGDIFTRLSCIVMGLGNLVRGQIVKGLLFLGLEIAFIAFMAMKGINFLQGLVTLGTKKQEEVYNETKFIYEYVQGDNSLLFLLYGICTILLVGVFFFLWRAAIKSAYEAQCRKEAGRRTLTIKDDVRGLFDQNLHKTLLTIPMICVFAFTILPLIFMACMAFTNYDRNHQVPGNLFTWVGLDIFKELFSQGNGFGYAFWHILGWTVVWAVFATFLNYFMGMILAIIINRKGTKCKGMWRFIFILSIAIPQFVSLLVMGNMLTEGGSIIVLLKDLGLIEKSLPFWTDATWARITIIIVNLWIGIPYTMMQTTGILQNIPADLYEAARVDGANPVVIFFKITLPYMLFVTGPYLITSFIGNINNFNVIFLLTKGAPMSMEYFNGTGGKTDLLVTWLYHLTIDLKDYNYGAVVAIMVFVISAGFALLAYRHTGAYKNEEGFQ